jgi:hypothetical protein
MTRKRAGRPRNRGSIPGRSKRFWSSTWRSDRRWSPFVYVFSGSAVTFSLEVYAAEVWHDHSQIIPRLSIRGAVPPLPDTSWHFALLKTGNFTFVVIHTNVFLEVVSTSEGTLLFRHELCSWKLTEASYRSRLGSGRPCYFMLCILARSILVFPGIFILF